MTDSSSESLKAWTDEAERALMLLLTSWFARVGQQTMETVSRCEPLWHYTTRQAFEKIIATNVIWATDLGYLNDDTELSYVLDLVAEVRPNTRVDTNLTSRPRPHPIMGYDLRSRFGFSLSKSRDDRSQWDTYAPPPDGVALGFDPKKLFMPPAGEGGLVPCMYDRRQQLASVRWACDLLDESRLPTALHPFLLGNLVRMWSPWMKPETFQSENESRWVPAGSKRILERHTARGMAPYVECRFNPRALVEVMIADGTDASRRAVHALLPPPSFAVSIENVRIARSLRIANPGLGE